MNIRDFYFLKNLPVFGSYRVVALILASSYQWCIFRYYNSGIYKKIVDMKMGNSFMGSVDWVDFEKDEITVHFKNNRTLERSGNFSFVVDALFLK